MKDYKKSLILSSLLTLLPIPIGLLLWDKFPAQMAVHWELNGEADGWGSPFMAVFAMPLIMLVLNLACVLITIKDAGNQGRNKKPLKLVLWIVPIISNFSCYLMYALALGMEFNIAVLMQVPLGVMFAVIGNYMPKMKKNATMGIKVPWVYSSEENWNATHRFGGRVWMIGGILMALSAFLPAAIGGFLFVAAMIALVVIPIVYSYLYYRKQKAEGTASLSLPKMSGKAWIAVVVLLIFLGFVLFSGSIDMNFREYYLHIDPSCYSDLVVEYDDILDIEYREENVDGLRVGGYGSFRLLLGYFQNEEFGTYLRYTYYKPEACVVLTTHGNTIVLSGETESETEALYQELLSRTE